MTLFQETLDQVNKCKTKNQLQRVRDEIYIYIINKLNSEQSFLLGEYIRERFEEL